MKLMLGTVQFGLDYGISNLGGQTAPAEVESILRSAAAGGIFLLDTANAYGNSEELLGRLSLFSSGFEIVTKVPGLGVNGSALACLRESRKRLRRESVYGVLFHNSGDLLGPRGKDYFAELLATQKSGEVRKIGISAYSAWQVEEVLSRFPLDLIQVPVNALDQRLLRSGFLRQVKNAGVEVHARSPFLQGLLLMDPSRLSKHFEPVRDQIASLQHLVRKRGASLPGALLRFLSVQPEIDRVVFGVNNTAQLEELLKGYNESEGFDFSQYAFDEEIILNPSCWPRGNE